MSVRKDGEEWIDRYRSLILSAKCKMLGIPPQKRKKSVGRMITKLRSFNWKILMIFHRGVFGDLCNLKKNV